MSDESRLVNLRASQILAPQHQVDFETHPEQKYSVPLLTIEGYKRSLSFHSIFKSNPTIEAKRSHGLGERDGRFV